MNGSAAADASVADAGSNPVDASTMMAEGSADGSGVEDGEVPLNHRADASACPVQRGSISPQPCDAAECAGDCTSDSDCEAGVNGRCGLGPSGPPYYACGYDECLQNSDCDAEAPCLCRPSGTSIYANICLSGGNCAADSDCGPGGYCSPSALGCVCLSTALCGDSGACYAGGQQFPCACGDACGHGYFCHTPRDVCVNDSDCPAGGCNYDPGNQRWECAFCLPRP